MKADIAIIGGGIVGLATAEYLLRQQKSLKLVLLEKEAHLAAHQTGNNSGVIHSGIYYKPGSLKAENCIRGYRMLLEFCDLHHIPYELCGKVIVAMQEKELEGLEKLYQRGLENGLKGLKMLNRNELREIEPHVNSIAGIKVPQTGIINYKTVCEKLGELIRENGGEIWLNGKVTAIREKDEGFEISTQKGPIEAGMIVNCTGLYSDKVSEMHLHKTETRIIPFRGEYYELLPEAQHLVKHLIYPVPDPNFPFLGVHFTRMIGGGIEAGPNAVLAFRREGYKRSDIHAGELIETLLWPGFQKVMWKYWKTGLGEMRRSFSKKAFTKALQNLIPELKPEHLRPAPAGVRAQACDRNGGLLDDFKIVTHKHAVHVLNAPSPAATSSLSIGETVGKIVLGEIGI